MLTSPLNAFLGRVPGRRFARSFKNEASLPQSHERSTQPSSERLDEFLVRFDVNEPLNPRAWSTLYRSWISIQLSFMALAAGLGSSLLTPAYSAIAQDFGIDRDLTVLNTSLYVYVGLGALSSSFAEFANP
jgi:hypothetical protein